jgi:hypothetical protein
MLRQLQNAYELVFSTTPSNAYLYNASLCYFLLFLLFFLLLSHRLAHNGSLACLVGSISLSKLVRINCVRSTKHDIFFIGKGRVESRVSVVPPWVDALTTTIDKRVTVRSKIYIILNRKEEKPSDGRERKPSIEKRKARSEKGSTSCFEAKRTFWHPIAPYIGKRAPRGKKSVTQYNIEFVKNKRPKRKSEIKRGAEREKARSEGLHVITPNCSLNSMPLVPTATLLSNGVLAWCRFGV